MYRELKRNVLKLQNILVARATGRTDPDKNEYQELREKIILQKEFDEYIPDFIFSCRTLDQFWYFIRPKFSHYDERRKFLQDKFDPLLSYIEEKQHSRAQEQSFEYDVALSFAGEERTYVEKVAKYLKDSGVKVFYDKNEEEEARLWGVDLTEFLYKIYAKESLYCVMFISKNYSEKIWTRHEKRSALERAIKEKREYILPARFDDIEIKGLPSTLGFIDLRVKTPEELGKVVLIKLQNRI